MKNCVFILCSLLAIGFAKAQTIGVDSLKLKPGQVVVQDSSVQTVPDSVIALNKKKKFIPNPSLATKLALIPGGGQFYNRDYWKLPIIYLGIGGGIYTYILNTAKYNDFLTAYKSFYDLSGDAESNSNYGELIPGVTSRPFYDRDFFSLAARPDSVVEGAIYPHGRGRAGTIDQIKKGKNYWRRNRNLSIIVAVLIYGLTIVEANVAAHLKTFDLTDDLSLGIEPKFSQPMVSQPTPGLRLVFNFK